MFNQFSKVIFGLVLAAIAGVAIAATGVVPNPGPQLIDGTYVQGLANGVNSSYQYGITAAGTTQATAYQLPANITLIEVDTVAANSGVNLVSALAGTEVSIYNNGSQTLTVYPTTLTNPVSNAADTINNGSSTTVLSHNALYCFSAKSGIWACK